MNSGGKKKKKVKIKKKKNNKKYTGDGKGEKRNKKKRAEGDSESQRCRPELAQVNRSYPVLGVKVKKITAVRGEGKLGAVGRGPCLSCRVWSAREGSHTSSSEQQGVSHSGFPSCYSYSRRIN